MRRSPLAVIFVTVFLDLVGFGIVIPILPYCAETYGASPRTIGFLLSIFSLMQFVMAPVWGRVSDRIGRRPVLLVALTASAVSYVGLGLAPTLTWLFIARGFAGAAGGSISTAQAYIADVTTPQDRAKGMGLIGAAFGLGFILGPAIGGLLAGESQWIGHHLGGAPGAFIAAHRLAAPMFFAAGLTTLNVIAAAVRLPESLSPEMRRLARGKRAPRLRALMTALSRPHLGSLITVFFLATAGFSMMEATFALLAERRMGLTEKEVGGVFAFIGVIAVIIQGGLIGRLTRRFGEWRLLPTGLGFVSLGLLGLAFAQAWPGLLLAGAILSLGNALTAPSTNALISRTAAAHEQGGTLGLSQSAGALARIIGPSIGGALFGLSDRWPYFGGATLTLLALVVSLVASSRIPAQTVESTAG